ncbi:MAG: Penicillin-binding protein, 1A family [Candidatus Moranbacteria bacterium GW2011_GWA2_39_41]|nr:MAG: Penicillin-binding protein, 1A family [Candidatus Moranbacteria bacterium GW2011_GWA2_39_41]
MKHVFIAFKDFKSASKQDRWKMLWKLFLYSLGVFLVLMLGVFAYFAKDLPDASGISKRSVTESTKIYDRTGDHLLYDIHGEEKRTQVQFKDMPDAVKYATISLEDQNFYHHPGFDVNGLLNAVISNVLRRGGGRGGSTITQQFVKNSILTDERSLSRKVKELILAIELEFKFSKDQILAMYLNEIPYGSNAYGIEAAAQTFFGKSASQLTLDESALLASLPQAPSYYSPNGNHADALRGRQVYALNQMAKFGYITQEQADAAKEVDVLAKIKPVSENISAPHFVMYIKEYLEKKYGQDLLEKGGLKVYTTLDWDKQQIAELAVREGATTNTTKYKAENASLVAMDPRTGQILAMVGSKDYFDKSIDGQVNVAVRERQPGSSFKPYVYLSAFKKGYTPDTQLWDVDINFAAGDGQVYNPKNYDGKNRGPVAMKEALAMSLNVPAVETLYLAGVKDSIATAKSLGITSLNKNADNYGLSLVLGGGEVTLLDHTNAYGTLATGGVHHDKTGILKVVDTSGDVLEAYKDDSGQRVIDEKYVAMLDSVMSTNSLRAPVFGTNNPFNFSDRPVAAKTGTTNEWRDGWAMGYTPSIVAGVWAGNNDNTIMAPGADGIFVAAPIWRKFMDGVLKNYTVEQFPKYEKEDTGKPVLDGTLDPVEKIEVCKIKKDKYCLASDACPDGYSEKKTFFSGHNILWYVNKDDPRGDYPKHPEDDPQFKSWEKAVQKWAENDKDFSKNVAPTEKCESSDFSDISPDVKISSPGSGSTISGDSFTVSASGSSDFGIDKITIYVNGSEIGSQSDSSISKGYSIPADKRGSDLEIKATVESGNGNSKSTSLTVHTTPII